MLALGGCIATSYPYIRTETAQRIAAPAWMIKRDVPAAPFMLRAYERIHNRGGIAHLYIEGDGNAYAHETPLSRDPTPDNPVALHLASKDKADNVIYLARPCQYTGMISKGELCHKDYWNDKKFSKEVIAAYDEALDEISRRYNLSGFHLVGYSGGAAIATLLGVKRKDIMSVRTVSGILDHEAHSAVMGKPALAGSLNPVNEASHLTKMPQYHFVGGQDETVPPAVLHSYLQAMPPTRCVQTMLIQEAGHDEGWVNKWPELLELPVTCYNSDTPELGDVVPPPQPGNMVRTKPIKP